MLPESERRNEARLLNEGLTVLAHHEVDHGLRIALGFARGEEVKVARDGPGLVLGRFHGGLDAVDLKTVRLIVEVADADVADRVRIRGHGLNSSEAERGAKRESCP